MGGIAKYSGELWKNSGRTLRLSETGFIEGMF